MNSQAWREAVGVLAARGLDRLLQLGDDVVLADQLVEDAHGCTAASGDAAIACERRARAAGRSAARG